MRLDQYLVYHQLVKTRNAAVKMIAAGLVSVDNQVTLKNNLNITDQTVTTLGALEYVSRAGHKLVHALKTFNLNVDGFSVIDFGSSTGGFADVCLQHNIKKIYCVDVGTNQLADKIKNDSRVVNLENTNLRDLTQHLIPDAIDLIVSDLSFISSRFMFEKLSSLNLKHGCHIISLIKPQFELDKTIIDHCHAKIENPKYHEQAISNVKQYALQANLKICGVISSPIKGAKKQNQEFLIWCVYV